MRSKVQGSPDYKSARDNYRLVGGTRKDAQGYDVVTKGILDLIEDVMYNFQSNKKKSLTILESKLALMSFKQKNRSRKLAISACYKKFKRYVKAHERNGGGFGYEVGLVKEALVTAGTDYDNTTPEQMKAATITSQEQMLAILFMYNADQDYCTMGSS